MIPRAFIQDLLNRVDIVDIIDRHVKLKRAGANFTACCPFHTEKSPSFTVSQSKQFYHCFGCGAHGTAISFLMEYSGHGFVDAVKELAQGVGMAVPEERSSNGEARRPRGEGDGEQGDDLYAAMLTAARYYRAALKDAPQAIAYLQKRGLSGEIARKFGIGYAPDGWQNLEHAFDDYAAEALKKAGLVKQNEEGRRYDIFRDRVMFPIVDVRGHIIGFGGRVIGPGEPKYLNSPETPLFEKGRELYGLYQARRAIRDAGRAVVVEGYMDVVALAQYGIDYAVATLGTATTPLHVQKLLRQTDEIVYCFDGDAAGRRAAWRALENSLGQLADGKQLRFLFLPPEHDPDTFVREHGREVFEKQLAEAMPLSQFLISELTGRVDRHTPEGRASLLKDARPLIAQIPAPMLSLLLRKELAAVAGIEIEELGRDFQFKPPQAPADGAAAAGGSGGNSGTGGFGGPAQRAYTRPGPPRQRPLVHTVIELLVLDPTLANTVARTDIEEALAWQLPEGHLLRALAQLLAALGDEHKPLNIGEFFRDSEYESLFGEIESETLRRQDQGFSAAEAAAEFADAWRRLLDNLRRARLQALLDKVKRSPWNAAEQEQFLLLQQQVSRVGAA